MFEYSKSKKIRFDRDAAWKQRIPNIGKQIGRYTLMNAIFQTPRTIVFSLDDENLVMKCIEKEYFNIELAKEIKKLDHENIVKYEDIIDCKTFVAIIMLRAKEDLFEYNRIFKPILEETVCSIIKFVLHGLIYLHSNNIWHCDIKLENLLLMRETQHGSLIKITDFELSKKCDSNIFIKACGVGTLPYAAPELVEIDDYGKLDFKSDAEYGCNIDIWSLGVTMYLLLYDRLPFTDYESLINGRINFTPPQNGQPISQEANDLISKMLIVDNKQRPAAHELLNHNWFQLYEEKPRLNNEIVQCTNIITQTLYQTEEIES